ADRSHLALYAASLPRSFGIVPLLLAGLGALTAWRRAGSRIVLALTGYALGQAWFFTRVGFPSNVPWLRGVIERFYILPTLVLAFLAGLGAAWILERSSAHARTRLATLALVLATALVPPLVAHARFVSQRGNRFTENLGRAVLASLPAHTVLFVQGDLLHNAVEYLTWVEHRRPDVVVLD